MNKFSKNGLIFAYIVVTLILGMGSVFAVTEVGTATVSAVVLGQKPLVNLIVPVSAINNVVTPITKIVGRNFDNAYGVSLDDSSSTVLTGTITILNDCDANGDNCGGGGSYQLITGMSVPADVMPGVYNVLVTTPLGTNLLADTKLTISSPAATAIPVISEVSPSYLAAGAGINDQITVSFKITDSDTSAVSFDGDSNLTVFGATVDNHLPVTQTTVDATVVDGERVSFRFNSNSVAEIYGSLDIRVGDGGTSTTGNTNTKTVAVFIEPVW